MTQMPAITVIIPTRERADVLEKALSTVVAQNYERLHIIVSDNCSNDGTADVVSSFHDSRIRYVRTQTRLSMADNYEAALTHAPASWVGFMGDDDGLCIQAIPGLAQIISETGALAVRSRTVTFDWPGTHGRDHGALIVPMGRGYEIRKSAQWLSRVMRGLAPYAELPMAYNGGFVHKDVFDAIRARGGRYFRSSSPDVYSAIAVASVTDRYAFSHEPLSINGTSKHSIGTSFHRGQDNSAAAKRFFSEGNIPLHPDVPLDLDGSYPLSLHALVLEAYLQSSALRAPESVDFSNQLAIMLALERPHRRAVKEWGSVFASHHGLSLQGAERRATLLRGPLLARSVWLKAARAANSIMLDDAKLPLNDVYQCSLAVAIVRGYRSRVTSLFRAFRHRRRVTG